MTCGACRAYLGEGFPGADLSFGAQLPLSLLPILGLRTSFPLRPSALINQQGFKLDLLRIQNDASANALAPSASCQCDGHAFQNSRYNHSHTASPLK
jgi:hypothetical protein